jgi:hypothetical protein
LASRKASSTLVLGEMLLLLVGAGPSDRARQTGDLEQLSADLEDVAELTGARQESVCGLAADTPPGQQVVAELGQGCHAVVDHHHAAAGEQANGQLRDFLRGSYRAVSRVGHPLDNLRGIGRTVEQQRRGDKGRTLERRATARTETAAETGTAGPAMTPAVFAPTAAETAVAAKTARAAEAAPETTEAPKESVTRHPCRSFPIGS